VRIVFDADVLAYSCGFAAQKTTYDYIAHEASNPGRVLRAGTADTMTEAKEPFKDNKDVKVLCWPNVVAEPVENAIYLCKRSLEVTSTRLAATGISGPLELYLTGKGNFRERVATIKGYKANRIGIPKPVHYEAIREYMTHKWGATTVVGYEADDQVAMIAHENNYDPDRVCIVSADKDLLTVPGLVYNFQTESVYLIPEDEARTRFYRQILTGDTADNILGCYKVGPKAAMAAIHEDMSEEMMKEECLSQFEASTLKKGCPYQNAEAAFIETGRLVHMCRTLEETTEAGWWAP
jgi:hypothetical protein